MITQQQHDAIYKRVKALYAEHEHLPFHGWHHINFVYKKSVLFARELGANILMTQSSALVHDLNYLSKKGIYTKAIAGKDLRHSILDECALPADTISQVESIVNSAELGSAHDIMSLEAKALSDADTLFKALPVTPVLFASAFIKENNYDIRRLAKMIVENQEKLIEEDRYFHSDMAKHEYMRWAQSNLTLWREVNESLDDPDVIALLDDAGYKLS